MSRLYIEDDWPSDHGRKDLAESEYLSLDHFGRVIFGRLRMVIRNILVRMRMVIRNLLVRMSCLSLWPSIHGRIDFGRVTFDRVTLCRVGFDRMRFGWITLAECGNTLAESMNTSAE